MWQELVLLPVAFSKALVLGSGPSTSTFGILSRQVSSQDHQVQPNAHAAVAKQGRAELLRKFAPIIYLHPDDQYLPGDPADTFRRYYNATTDLMTIPESAIGGMPLSFQDDHGRLKRVDHFELDQPHIGQGAMSHGVTNTSTDDYNGFKRPVAQKGRGRVTAPVTAQSRIVMRGSHAGKIYLQYWYWHFFNGAQGFAVTSPHGSKRDKDDITRWEWWPLAIHTADWEHTTITLAPVAGSKVTADDVLAGHFNVDDFELESVYYTVHSEVEDRKNEFPREGTHPIVYSHLNSHAGYAVPGDYWNKDPGFDGFINSLVRVLSFGRIKQIKVVDIGFDPSEAIRWADYDIYDISDATEGEAPDWALWRGHWGQPVDQTTRVPPPSYVPARKVLSFMLWLLRTTGKLKRFVKPIKKAPRSGFAHHNWISLDLLPDDWAPEIKKAPPPMAVAAFLFSICLAFGSWIVLLSGVIILCIILARFTLRRSQRGSKLRIWPVTWSMGTEPDDEQVTESLLANNSSRGHSRGPSEIFETDTILPQKLSWFRERYARFRKDFQ